jgi:MoaA/NifB/PqqE/SkfB family radical SAM enzyme
MASLRTKLRLLRGLLDGEVARTGPAWLAVEVTRRCNLTCLGCRFHPPQARRPERPDHQVQDLPSELVEKLRVALPKLGSQHVILTGGGEPLLHPKLLDFLAAFKQAGFKIELFTNGTLIDAPMARRLVASGLDHLRMTFWAVNSEEHAHWHPGTSLTLLEKRTEALRLIAQAKREAGRRTPQVALEMLLHRQNMHNLPQRVEVALENGCDSVAFTYFRDWGGECQSLTVSPSDAQSIRPALAAAGRRLYAGGVRHNVPEYLARARSGHQAWRDLPCYAGWYGCYVIVDGTVTPCSRCRMRMGNLLERSFAEIWNGPQYREFRRRTSTRTGLASLGSVCNCDNCCQVRDNVRVHRIFKWFAPLAPKAADARRGSSAAG